MIRRLMTASLFVALAGATAPTFAQPGILDLLRSDIATQKKALLTQALHMTEQQNEVFWPIYDDYQRELNRLGERRSAMLKDYSDHHESMTDKMAAGLTRRALDYEEKRLKLYRKYNGRFSKALSPKIAARWLQAEHVINTMIDVQIVSELPMMQ